MKELLEWFAKHTYHFQLSWDKDKWKAQFRSRPLEEFYYDAGKVRDQGSWYYDEDKDVTVLLMRFKHARD